MKKFIAIILSICLTLGICVGAFSAETDKSPDKTEKGEEDGAKTRESIVAGYNEADIDAELIEAVLTILQKMSNLGADGNEEDYLEMLGITDALGSGRYNSNVTEYFEDLLSSPEKYAEGRLTEEDFLNLIRRGSENILGIDEKDFEAADENDKLNIDDIAYIFGLFGLDEDIEIEEYEETLFSMLFVMRLIEIYFEEDIRSGRIGTEDVASIMYALYTIFELYEAGLITSVTDIEEIIKVLGLEGKVDLDSIYELAGAVYVAAAVSYVAETAETEQEAEKTIEELWAEIEAALKSAGATDEEIAALGEDLEALVTKGWEALWQEILGTRGGRAEKTLEELWAEIEAALKAQGATDEEIAVLGDDLEALIAKGRDALWQDILDSRVPKHTVSLKNNSPDMIKVEIQPDGFAPSTSTIENVPENTNVRVTVSTDKSGKYNVTVDGIGSHKNIDKDNPWSFTIQVGNNNLAINVYATKVREIMVRFENSTSYDFQMFYEDPDHNEITEDKGNLSRSYTVPEGSQIYVRVFSNGEYVKIDYENVPPGSDGVAGKYLGIGRGDATYKIEPASW